MEKPFPTSNDPIGYKEIYNLTSQQIEMLDRSTIIQAAALSLYDFIRFKQAYGLTENTIEMGREFGYLFTLLNSQEYQQALDLATDKLKNSYKI
jgi:hypothetical protein